MLLLENIHNDAADLIRSVRHSQGAHGGRHGGKPLLILRGGRRLLFVYAVVMSFRTGGIEIDGEKLYNPIFDS